jgi:hypothetical protein
MDIITTIDEFIIALRTTRLTITVTGIAIITVNIGRTMINPRLEILVGELPNLQYSHNSLLHFRRAHVWRRGCKQFGTRGVLDCKATDTDDPRKTRASAKLESRPSRTPALSTGSAWKPSRKNCSRIRWTSWSGLACPQTMEGALFTFLTLGKGFPPPGVQSIIELGIENDRPKFLSVFGVKLTDVDLEHCKVTIIRRSRLADVRG